MKCTVVHHSADFDGIFCREIARKFLPDAELIGWDYGNPKIPFPAEQVYLLDLSPECFLDFETSPKAQNRLIWIDHHKSAFEKFEIQHKFGDGYRIDGVAACRLAWFYFTALERYKSQTDTADFTWFQGHYPWAPKTDFIERKVDEPLAVRLAGEYDIWDKRDPDTELFQHGLRSIPLTEHMWKELLQPNHYPNLVGKLLQNGKSIQYARTQENESIINSAGFTIQFEGLTFLACNHARYNSQLFTAGLTPEHDACFGFAWRNGKWAVSLYHAPGKEHHDLSKIAVKYGGGGHRGACGFQIDKLPFLK